MATIRRTSFTVTEDATRVLAGVGNRSAYISEAIVQRSRAWRAALSRLIDSGMTVDEIAGSCRAYGVGVPVDGDLLTVALEWAAGNTEVIARLS